MSWTFCISGPAIAKGGTHANSSVIINATIMDSWSTEAEGFIEGITGKDFTTGYAGLSTGIKGILTEISSSLIGMKIATYDPTGYLPREWDGIMNFNDEIIQKGLASLKDFNKTSLKQP